MLRRLEKCKKRWGRTASAVRQRLVGPVFKNVLKFPIKGFDFVLNLLIGKWLFIVAGVLIWSFVYVLIKNVFPFLGREFGKIAYIHGVYKLDKEVKKKSKKLQIELKILEDDIKKELGLLQKIKHHRPLRSDEKYLKEKLEKYSQLLKSLRWHFFLLTPRVNRFWVRK